MSDVYQDTLIRPTPLKDVAEPKMWAILLLNDDFTPMEFVVFILVKVLHIDLDDATRIMLKVHEQGSAKVGRFSRDVAETKALEINQIARANEQPLTVDAVEAD